MRSVSTPLEILIVEDEPVTLRSLIRTLRAHGFRPIVASSCQAARTVRSCFEIAVFDIDLGDGDGVSLAEELLSSGSVRRVIFHSGTASAVRQRLAGSLGAVVPKSGDAGPLLAAIRGALSRPGHR